MSTSSSAQRAREALAQRLKEIRLDAGLTARAVATAAGWHESKCSRIEAAKQSPSDTDIRTWCRVCGADDQAADLIAASRAAEEMWTQWRRVERGGLKALQEATVPLWERTKKFRIYSPWLIPGPVQTAEYIRALLEQVAGQRPEGLRGIDEAVAVRLAKQHVVEEGDHTFAILLEEAAIRARIGDPAVMAGQLGHLLTAAAFPSVSLGVIPLSADRTTMTAVEGFFLFDDAQVNVELVSGWLRITTPGEIAMYAQTFAELANQAVYGADARALITSAISTFE